MVNTGLPTALADGPRPPRQPRRIGDTDPTGTLAGDCRHTGAITAAAGQLHAQIAVAILAHAKRPGTVESTDEVIATVNGTDVPITITWKAEIPQGGIHRADEIDPQADLGC